MKTPAFDTDLEIVRLVSAHPRSGAPVSIIFLHEKGWARFQCGGIFPSGLRMPPAARPSMYSRYGYIARRPSRRSPLTPATCTTRRWWPCCPRCSTPLDLDRPFLFGHSDGGSVSLINAGSTARPLSASS